MASQHRGLPPPAAMVPTPSPHPSSSQPSSLPTPSNWMGSDDTLRSWLQAKTEEERRKTEELRLEVRRMEFQMLQEAVRFGVHPSLIPVIFAGGVGLAGTSADWAQQYIGQLHGQQQTMQHPPSPELRRETRLIGSHPQDSRVPPIGHSQPPPIFSQPSYPPPMSPRRGDHRVPISAAPLPPPPPTHPQPPSSIRQPPLPRLSTGEMPPQSVQVMQHQGGPPPSQPASQETPVSQSPGIYFHMWQPPQSTQGTTTPTQPTASPSSRLLESPFTSQQHHLTAVGEASSSPSRKRKAGGSSHQPPPPPSTQPTYTASQTSSAGAPTSGSVSGGGVGRRRTTGHSRHRSDSGAGRGYEPYPRSTARHRRTSGAESPLGGRRDNSPGGGNSNSGGESGGAHGPPSGPAQPPASGQLQPPQHGDSHRPYSAGHSPKRESQYQEERDPRPHTSEDGGNGHQ